ncbi:MerR family transcriptional regulator, partial [Clostridium neonatale]|uniref:MerR family transcriptional regulator n=1 Tax=Clostridium neonatale TaxID=137838 RepID=UPI001330CD8C
MKISEFAKRSGVTIKTLLHYEKIGLLIPSSRNGNGYRVYLEEDFLKLQQITTLKYIGLSLKEINHIINENNENLENMICIQKKALEEKKKHIEEVIKVFDKAEMQAKENGSLDADSLINIIKITNMESTIKEQYNSDKNLNLRSNLHSYNVNKIDWDVWCFENMKFCKNDKVLELGCGNGKLWLKNKEKIETDLNITLSDFSKSMIKSAKNNLKEINMDFQYKEINAEKIPYKDETFDVIIAEHMIYFVSNIEKALEEIKRVLKPNGKVYITTNSKNTMNELNELCEKFAPNSGLSNNGLSERFNLEEGEKLLKKYFNNVSLNVLEGKIILSESEPLVSYKASTIQGKSILIGKKRIEFKDYLDNYIKENKQILITTKAG